jgi:uncharacterized protein YegP (UPF0339 family)
MCFHVYLDAGTPSQWRWALFAANGRKLANSGEGYRNHDDCIHALSLVARSADSTISYSDRAARRLDLQRRLRRGRGV